MRATILVTLAEMPTLWHLRKVFTKLGIGSRRKVAKALPTSGSDPVPA